jgi:hypothetical protein
VGLAPAATVFTPSRKMAWASTVAVVVPSPATSEVFDATSRTICAPMFSSGSCSSISLCYRHAVLGNDRRAEFLFNHRVAALGAEGDLYRVREGVDASQDRLAGCFTSHDLLCHESFSSSSMISISFAILNSKFEILNLKFP